MAKANKKAMARLNARLTAYDKLSSKQGTKRPGSMRKKGR